MLRMPLSLVILLASVGLVLNANINGRHVKTFPADQETIISIVNIPTPIAAGTTEYVHDHKAEVSSPVTTGLTAKHTSSPSFTTVSVRCTTSPVPSSTSQVTFRKPLLQDVKGLINNSLIPKAKYVFKAKICDSFPANYRKRLSLLLEKLSVHKSGQQLLEKLNILENPSTLPKIELVMSLDVEKADRLLRLIAGMKRSKSGRALLQQLGLGKFSRLPEAQRQQTEGFGGSILRSDVPIALDFTSYNYNGGDNAMDELLSYILRRYQRRHGSTNVNNRSPGFITTEMDMVLNADQLRQFYDIPNSTGRKRHAAAELPVITRNKRKAIRHRRYYWPGNTVPYELNENEFSWSDIMLFERAMYEWEQATCIRFKMATSSDVNRIRFRNGPGCSSHVGMIGGAQNITLQGPCRIRRIVLHEIGHSLGLVHEHQRPDRDDFIAILYENARPGTQWDFKKRTWASVVNHTVAYDYESVMHYGPRAFSVDRIRQTILTRDPYYQDIIGKVTELSFDDKKLVNLMYDCGGNCAQTIRCDNGGYLNKHCRCVCHPRFPHCEVRVAQPVTYTYDEYNSNYNNHNTRHRNNQFDWMNLFSSFSWDALNNLGEIFSSADPSGDRKTRTRSRIQSVTNPRRGWLLDMLDYPQNKRRTSNHNRQRVRTAQARYQTYNQQRFRQHHVPYHFTSHYKRRDVRDQIRQAKHNVITTSGQKEAKSREIAARLETLSPKKRKMLWNYLKSKLSEKVLMVKRKSSPEPPKKKEVNARSSRSLYFRSGRRRRPGTSWGQRSARNRYRTNTYRKRKLPNLSLSYFRQRSENERQARLKHARYHSRRRYLEKNHSTFWN